MKRKDNKRTTLGAIAEFANGGAWNQTEYSDEGVPVVRVTDIKNETVDLAACKFLPKSSVVKYEKNLLRTGDLVICTVGSHPTQPGSVVGRAAVIPLAANGTLLNQNAVVIRSASPDVDQAWLSYFGRSREFHDYIISCARGSASQVRMAIGLLKEMPVDVPPLHVQQSTAGILSAYDELIDICIQRIKILESMARALYREWFVHFRFPGHQNYPRVVSPLGAIPQGWEVRPIQHFGKVITGKTPSKANAAFFGDDVPFVKTPDMHGNMFVIGTNERLSKSGAKSQANKTIPAGSICVSCIGTIGVVSLTTQDCQTNQQINSVVLESEVSREFLFLRLQDAKQALENLGSNGATMGNVNKGKFEAMEIVGPPAGLLAEYHRLAQPMFNQILTLSRQIQNLRRTRDLLLPRLLSGQVEIEAA